MAEQNESRPKAGKKQEYKVLRNLWNGASAEDMIRRGTTLKLTEEQAAGYPAGALELSDAQVLEVASPEPTPPAPPPQK